MGAICAGCFRFHVTTDDNQILYFKYPQEVRRLIHTTNTIEGFNRQLRKITKSKSVFRQSAENAVAAAFILSLALGPLAGKMRGSMFWFFEYQFTILPALLTIPVFLLLGWLIPCMMYDNVAKCSVVE